MVDIIFNILKHILKFEAKFRNVPVFLCCFLVRSGLTRVSEKTKFYALQIFDVLFLNANVLAFRQKNRNFPHMCYMTQNCTKQVATHSSNTIVTNLELSQVTFIELFLKIIPYPLHCSIIWIRLMTGKSNKYFNKPNQNSRLQ